MANVKTLHLKRSDGSQTNYTTDSHVGAVELTLRCDCIAEITNHDGGFQIIQSPYPCHSIHDEIKVQYIIPSVWTNLESIFLHQQPPIFSNHSAILNIDWSTTILNVCPISNLDVQPLWESARVTIITFTNIVVQYIWLAVNSLIVIVII